MSRIRSCVGILFVLSMIIGIYLGYTVLTAINSDKGAEPCPIQSPIDPQSTTLVRTVLVVGVDSLEEGESGLEGAWLVTLIQPSGQATSEPRLNFNVTTLYPVTNGSLNFATLSMYTQAHPKIVVDPNNLASIAEIDPIAPWECEWQDIIVMDEVVLNMVIALQDPNVKRPIVTPGPDTFIKPWNDPAGAFKQQHNILVTLCNNPETLGQLNIIQEILATLGTHLTSTRNYNGLLSLWQTINPANGQEVMCTLSPD